MADFDVRAVPLEGWSLEFRGGQAFQVHGPLLASCVNELISCASLNGCLESGNAHLTDQCAATLQRHNLASGCIAQGFGLRVKAQGGSRAQAIEVDLSDWLPRE
jgi:hypothetical protein